MVIRNFKYKAYRSKHLKCLHEQINIAAWIWNHCIALQRRYYKLYGGYIGKYVLQKHIAKLRKRNLQWQKLNSQSVQEIVERVDTAYQRFFKKIAKRPPKFKKARKFTSFVLKQSGWKLDGNVLTIQKKRYKFSLSRELSGKIKRISVKRNKLSEVFFVFTCETEPVHIERKGNAFVGIDFGLTTFLTLSDGTKILSPLFFKQSEEKIKKLHQRLSSRVKGSKNYLRALIALQREYINVANKRRDHHWKLAHLLCSKYAFIAIEDLNLEGMKRLWGKKVSDLGFAEFVEILKQVALKYNTQIQVIDRFYPSSKLCSCGTKNDNLTLDQREWVCVSCGTIHNRDLLAANNILGEGIRQYRTERKTTDPVLFRELESVATQV
jgi:putative transposase